MAHHRIGSATIPPRGRPPTTMASPLLSSTISRRRFGKSDTEIFQIAATLLALFITRVDAYAGVFINQTSAQTEAQRSAPDVKADLSATLLLNSIVSHHLPDAYTHIRCRHASSIQIIRPCPLVRTRLLLRRLINSSNFRDLEHYRSKPTFHPERHGMRLRSASFAYLREEDDGEATQ